MSKLDAADPSNRFLATIYRIWMMRYVDVPEEAQRKSMLDLGMPEWQVNALLDLQRYYKNGQGGELTDVLPRLLGRQPVKLEHFLQEFKDEFRSQAASA